MRASHELFPIFLQDKNRLLIEHARALLCAPSPIECFIDDDSG